MSAIHSAQYATEKEDFSKREPIVMVVDDDPSIISAMQRNFHPYRVQLQVAFHGMQGIVNAVSIKPDVIVTDLQMPFASGDELISCLSRHPSTTGVPIIVITGKPGATLTSRFWQMGVKSVLGKPLHFDTLVEELKREIPMESRSR